MKKTMIGATCALTLVLGSFALVGCSSQEQKSAVFSGVPSVAELATLQCSYHTVATAEQDGGLFDVGYT